MANQAAIACYASVVGMILIYHRFKVKTLRTPKPEAFEYMAPHTFYDSASYSDWTETKADNVISLSLTGGCFTGNEETITKQGNLYLKWFGFFFSKINYFCL